MLHHDQLFAPLDIDLHLERIAGGNETEVYCTDDRRYVVKVKSEGTGSALDAYQQAVTLRRAAEGFAAVIGPRHSIPSYFILSRNSEGQVQPVVIQPYYSEAQALHGVDYKTLNGAARIKIAVQLFELIARSLIAFLQFGWMPDLYGRVSRSKEDRKRLNAWNRLPWRMWSFLVKRNILRSNNLMLTPADEYRLLLVDYDPVMRGKWYQRIYYSTRVVLFAREVILIFIMLFTGQVTSAE